MLDVIFATIGLLGLVAFMGVVTVFVMEPDLWIVAIVGVFIAVFFIRRDLLTGGRNLEESAEGEEPQS